MASDLIDFALLDFEDAAVASDAEGSPFARLFDVWSRMHAKLETESADADKLLDAQAKIMSMAAHLPAKSVEDVVYKLAFWRWDSNVLESDFSSLSRADQIVYSAFRDLVALTGVRAALTSADIASTKLRSSAQTD